MIGCMVFFIRRFIYFIDELNEQNLLQLGIYTLLGTLSYILKIYTLIIFPTLLKHMINLKKRALLMREKSFSALSKCIVYWILILYVLNAIN